MRLRIALETFVASSTFPLSFTLVNHQPYAPTRAGKIAPQAKPVNSGVRIGKNADQFAAAITYRQRPTRRSKSIEIIKFFVLPRTRAFLFVVKKIFFGIEK